MPPAPPFVSGEPASLDPAMPPVPAAACESPAETLPAVPAGAPLLPALPPLPVTAAEPALAAALTGSPLEQAANTSRREAPAIAVSAPRIEIEEPTIARGSARE